MLKVDGLNVHYGPVQVLHDVAMEISQGEVVAIIGANGAGKTTLLRSIMGLKPPTCGSIRFGGSEITGTRTERIVSSGLVMVPEGRRVFPLLSVLDNLLLGAYTNPQAIKTELDSVLDMFPRLRERKSQKAGTLSGGEQQMLAIGRGLMSRPKMLLLDEPSMGLAPVLVKQILATIAEISRRGTTILLVEQNARAALRMAHRAYVLELGKVVLSGSAQVVAADPQVLQAYLGEAAVRTAH
jgi:branched-chain amino acid transport system ATP-binding protein